MIAQGLPIYVALEPVDMRLGSERLSGLVRERMRAEPRSRNNVTGVGTVSAVVRSVPFRRPCSGRPA